MNQKQTSMKQIRRLGCGLAVLLGLLHAQPILADIQAYQIVRIIAYQSNCQLIDLKRTDRADGTLDFLGLCENVNFYPDGIRLHCPARDDAYACKILNKERRFNNLNMIRPSGSAK
jgi:hypothetical protein